MNATRRMPNDAQFFSTFVSTMCRCGKQENVVNRTSLSRVKLQFGTVCVGVGVNVELSCGRMLND